MTDATTLDRPTVPDAQRKIIDVCRYPCTRRSVDRNHQLIQSVHPLVRRRLHSVVVAEGHHRAELVELGNRSSRTKSRWRCTASHRRQMPLAWIGDGSLM
jgi:hypothetical protein